MATFEIEVDGQIFELESEGSLEDMQAFLNTEEGQDLLSQQLSSLSLPAPSAEPEMQGPPITMEQRLDRRQEIAAEQQEAEMGTGERILVGTGKVFNDIWQGGNQLLATVTGNDEEAAEIAAQISRERDIFSKFDEKQLGAEDVGEALGDLAALLPGGAAGLTIKGGALMGAALEGIKATTGGLGERALNAVIGGGMGAVGGGFGRLADSAIQRLSPATQAMSAKLGAGVNKEGLIDLAAGGLFRRMGVAPSNAGTVILSGIRKLGKQARASESAKRYLNNAATRVTAAEEKRLLAQRAKELDDFQAQAYDQMLGVVNRMDRVSRRGVINEETDLTLKQLVQESTKPLDSGRVGIDPADLIANMPLMSQKDLRQKLGQTFGKEVNALRTVWQEQAGQIITPEAIQAQVVAFNKNVTDELLPLLTKPNLSAKEKKAKATLLQSIIGPVGPSVAQQDFEE